MQKKNPPDTGGFGYNNIKPQEPPRSCLVESNSSYSGSGRLRAVNLLRIASNDSQRHNVHLRRLGTAGIYPFQCLLRLLFSGYSVVIRIPHFYQFHNLCFSHILGAKFVNLVNPSDHSSKVRICRHFRIRIQRFSSAPARLGAAVPSVVYGLIPAADAFPLQHSQTQIKNQKFQTQFRNLCFLSEWVLILFSNAFHPFRHSPHIPNSTLVKLGVRKEKDTLQPESDLLSGK